MVIKTILNNSIEVSLRILIILNELESSIDMQRIIYYDYALLHSGDFDINENSLYPSSPFRKEELYVKNSLIKKALNILCQKQLINIEYKDTGIFYKKNELTPLFLSHINAEYLSLLKTKAKWVNNNFQLYNDSEIKEYFDKTIGKWRSEFSTYGLTKRELVQNA